MTVTHIPTARSSTLPHRNPREELKAMSEAMVAQGGLLNHAQAAVVLNVSTKRVGELVRLGKLQRFDFLGRTYVSLNKVSERADQDLQAGRPVRNTGQRLIAAAKMLANTDVTQARVGAFGGVRKGGKTKKSKRKGRK